MIASRSRKPKSGWRGDMSFPSVGEWLLRFIAALLEE
jgi:hypothetical protein